MKINMQRTALNTGTDAVRSGFEIDLPRLQAWLQGYSTAFCGTVAIEQFRGGQSNPTYKLTTEAGQFVLRRRPPGPLLKSAHSVDREYRVLRALADTNIPTPCPVVFCGDDSIVGSTFYVMEFKSGRIFWDLLSGQQSPDDTHAAWLAAIDVLADLHSLDVHAIGLSDFGQHGHYFERQFKRWSEQYAYTRDAITNPPMDGLITWLAARVPRDDQTRLVHGDYQFSNMMFHESRSEVVAVLDWELSTLGHPLADLAYFCRVYHLPTDAGGLQGLNWAAQGVPSETELLGRYCARTSRPEIENWRVWLVFSMFRLAAIRQGVAKRLRDGTAASPHAASVATSAVTMADAALRLACAAG